MLVRFRLMTSKYGQENMRVNLYLPPLHVTNARKINVVYHGSVGNWVFLYPELTLFCFDCTLTMLIVTTQ